jgi:sterol desaturase/sphingolipid hydroxylase (fatty acid hydroxylase superfamily)
MSTQLIASESMIRIGSFFAVFAVFALCEAFAPRRTRAFRRRDRWPHNLGLLLLDVLVLRLVAPGAAVAVALLGEERGWGLLNALAAPHWVAVVVAVVALDLAIYFQHVMFHAVPALWRLHRTHHSDLDFDVTTGLRFHPFEILLSLGVKCAAVAALGAPATAVLLFEVLLNATAVFNHSNTRIPEVLDRWLRRFVVTPDMHRVHHSIVYNESSSNFGFNLPWWDRLFGTYRAQPAAGHLAMTIGVDAFRAPEDLRLDRLLVQPFRETPGAYPINLRQETS